MALARSAGVRVDRIESATLVPTPCTVLQQAKPFALDIRQEAEQADLVLAHMGLDRQRHRFALAGSACRVRASNAPDSRPRARRRR